MPVDRCMFRMSREIDGVMKTCVVLTYVDDLLVVGDIPMLPLALVAGWSGPYPLPAPARGFSQRSSHAVSNSTPSSATALGTTAGEQKPLA